MSTSNINNPINGYLKLLQIRFPKVVFTLETSSSGRIDRSELFAEYLDVKKLLVFDLFFKHELDREIGLREARQEYASTVRSLSMSHHNICEEIRQLIITQDQKKLDDSDFHNCFGWNYELKYPEAYM